MVDIVMLCKCKLPNLQIVKLRSLDIIKVSIPCNVMYFAASHEHEAFWKFEHSE